jgi:hypothetical protein
MTVAHILAILVLLTNREAFISRLGCLVEDRFCGGVNNSRQGSYTGSLAVVIHPSQRQPARLY